MEQSSCAAVTARRVTITSSVSSLALRVADVTLAFVGEPPSVRREQRSPDELLRQLAMRRHSGADAPRQVTHVERLPARRGARVDWPAWVPRDLVRRVRARGIDRPWRHQIRAAELARSGQHVVIATGTGSGKSLGYLLPVIADVLTPRTSAERVRQRRRRRRPPEQTPGQLAFDFDIAPLLSTPWESSGPLNARPSTALYVAPTKALAADQLRTVVELAGPDAPVTTYDGDSPRDYREWAQKEAAYVLTNPDMLHRSLLPDHERWARFLGSLAYVVIDEAHHYRGVFGSHVAQVLRRLQRTLEHYGANPVFVLASGTMRDPAETCERLIGAPVTAVTEDASPRGELAFALWEPLADPPQEERPAQTRRSAISEAGDLLADLVAAGIRSVVFVSSRRAAEAVALRARQRLAEMATDLVPRVAAYRGGYLPEERRKLERALQSGELVGVATTSALELGIDVVGLDAVVLAGYPGTRTSLWQRAGRAGRDQSGALAVLIPRDDPLDSYLVRHPNALFGPPVETTVFDPDNPYIIAPHLAAAAAELPLRDADLKRFGPHAHDTVDALAREGKLRRRRAGWYWTRRGRPSEAVDIRSSAGPQVRLVERSTGRLLGTVDAAAAHTSAHDGAIYLHQGEVYVVVHLDLDEAVALLDPAGDDHNHVTVAREIAEISILDRLREQSWGRSRLELGTVEVTSRVVSYLRLSLGGDLLGEHPLDLPPRTLRTRAVWWTVSDEQLSDAGFTPSAVPGAAHAAEHASIGLLPLFATCDRWDIGGVSTARHPHTGLTTVFVYDGCPGGAGFAERGYDAAPLWLRTTRNAIADCDCPDGCPSCVHSPKCGNGNNPLDKAGAVRLLDLLLADAPPTGDATVVDGPTARTP